MSPKLIALYVAGVVVLFGVMVYAGSRDAVSTNYSATSADRPIAEVANNSVDFGMMTNKEIKSEVFQVKNAGKSELQLTQVSTSCDCTYAYITASGEKSPKFTMHGKTSWIGRVAPSESAQIEVVYEPAIMPVKGPVERTVMVTTNDPKNQHLNFRITANVKE